MKNGPIRLKQWRWSLQWWILTNGGWSSTIINVWWIIRLQLQLRWRIIHRLSRIKNYLKKVILKSTILAFIADIFDREKS